MAESSEIITFGMSHHVAEVEVRERFAVPGDARAELRERLASELEIPGGVLISTCNRTELYAAVNGNEPDAAFADELRRIVFPGLDAGLRPYFHVGSEAVFHLFRVSAGLDSMVVGETEILGQLKAAFEESRAVTELDRALLDLFRQALVVGKRVRTETTVAEGGVSVAATAVRLARKIVGDLENDHAVIVGAGETGLLTARHLRTQGIGSLCFVNRTVERARQAAAEFDAEALPLTELEAALQKADVVVCALESPEPIIDRALMRRLRSRTRCLVDISVPRAIAADAADAPGTFVFDIDDLANLVDSVKDERKTQIDLADEIVVAEVHKFFANRTFAGMTPLVENLKQGFGEVLDGTVPHDHAAREASERLAKRLLGVALDSLKRSSRVQHSMDQIRASYELFLRGKRGDKEKS